MTYTRQFTEKWTKPLTSTIINGSNAPQISTIAVIETISGSRTGDKVLDWREKLRTGQNATSEYTLDRSRVVDFEPGDATLAYHSTGSNKIGYSRSRQGYVQSIAHGLSFNPAHISSSSSEAEATALSKTYKKLSSELSRLNSPAVVAEFMDVMRQFGKPADALVDLTNRRLNRLELEAKGLKGSAAFKRIKWAEVVASTYLEYAFGLAPLIEDTRSVAEALAQLKYEALENPKLRTKFQSRGETKLSDVSMVNGTHTPFTYVSQNIRTTAIRCQYVVGLEGEIRADLGSNDRLLQLLGFVPGNWIPAAWEVVPWSWLLDYFFNIQNILTAGVTSTARVKWISKTVSRLTESQYYGKWTGFSTSTGYAGYDFRSSTNHAGRYTALRTSMLRTSPVDLGVPPLVVTHPFNDVKKIANLAAVMLARKPSNSAIWLF